MTGPIDASASDGSAELLPPSSDLPAKAAKGFAWQVVSFGGNRIVVFLSTLALARLLAPSAFGVFAAALTFTQYLEAILDFGMGGYIIYDQRADDSEQRHVAFTFNLMLTAGLTGVAVALSPLTSRAFGAPHNQALFAVMALSLLIQGVGEVNQSIIERDLMFKKLVLIDLASAAVRAGLSVGLAAATGFGVWSIVVGFLAGQAISTLLTWAVVRYVPKLRFDWTLGRAMLSFGMNTTLVDLLAELSLNVDYLVVGSILGATSLGFYTIAYRLPELLINNFFWMFSTVAFPVYARSRAQGMPFLRKIMLRSLRLTTLYGFAAGVGLALVSRDAIGVLFGGKWHSAVAPMVILSLASAVASMGYASGPLFPAVGKPGTLVIVNLPLVAARVLGFVLAAPYGIFWVAFVHLLTNFCVIIVRLGIANHVARATAWETVRSLAPGLVVGAAIAVFALPVRLLGPPGVGTLIGTVLAGVVGAAVGLGVADRKAFAELRGILHMVAAT